jgi:hypothetical protein
MKKIVTIVEITVVIIAVFFGCKSTPDSDGKTDSKDYDKVPVLDAVEDLVSGGDYAAAAEQMSRLSDEERRTGSGQNRTKYDT